MNLQIQAEASLNAVIASMPTDGKVLSQYLAGLHHKHIVSLGENEAFALRTKVGKICSFKQKLVLSVDNGGLVQPVPGGPFVISAQGYEKWSEAAGANVMFPKTVIVDGVPQTNPHVVRDESNGRTKGIYARAVAFRYSDKGLPMVRDWTTFYDVPGYRMIDLIAKAAKCPQAFALHPTDDGKPTGPGKWGGYAFDEVMTLWVDGSHKEALDWYKTIINREKKAMDFAQTFACRNACKHLSGLQRAPSNRWELTVICWRPESGGLMQWDGAAYDNMLGQIESLGSGQGQIALSSGEKPITVEYTRGVDSMDAEPDLIGAEDEDSAPDQAPAEAAPIDMAPGQNGTYDHAPAQPPQATTPDPAPESPAAPALSEADQKAMANYFATREACPEEDAEARRRMGIPPDADVTPAQAQELYRIASAIVDGGAQ